MLKNVTGLPVLGTVSFIEPPQPASLLRREPVLIGAAIAGLAVAYLAGITLAEPVVRLIRASLG
jgi:hypothetical protein